MKREDIFDKLHDAVATTLLEKIISGEANASDLNVARQFLRDNGIAGIPQENSPLKNLMDELPFTEEEVEKKINGTTSSS
jgi:hypothetical protein